MLRTLRIRIYVREWLGVYVYVSGKKSSAHMEMAKENALQ